MKPVDLDMFRVAFVRVYVQYFTAVCVCVCDSSCVSQAEQPIMTAVRWNSLAPPPPVQTGSYLRPLPPQRERERERDIRNIYWHFLQTIKFINCHLSVWLRLCPAIPAVKLSFKPKTVFLVKQKWFQPITFQETMRHR